MDLGREGQGVVGRLGKGLWCGFRQNTIFNFGDREAAESFQDIANWFDTSAPTYLDPLSFALRDTANS